MDSGNQSSINELIEEALALRFDGADSEAIGFFLQGKNLTKDTEDFIVKESDSMFLSQLMEKKDPPNRRGSIFWKSAILLLTGLFLLLIYIGRACASLAFLLLLYGGLRNAGIFRGRQIRKSLFDR